MSVAAALCAFLCFTACSASSSSSGNGDSAGQPEGDADKSDDDLNEINADADSETVETEIDEESGPMLCNGRAELCALRLNEVAFPYTHNSFSNAEDGFVGPNQHFGPARQLADGVRGLMLDLHYYAVDGKDEIYLCHGDCLFGKRPLDGALIEIRDFLHDHPYEIMSIIFESYVDPDELTDLAASTGLFDYVYMGDLTGELPTLAEMIAGSGRLVLFTEGDVGAQTWLHHAWDHVWDTPYSNTSKDDLSCALNRGAVTNPLFLINHFASNPLPSEKIAGELNVDPFFEEWVLDCMQQQGRLPNFIAVDFYDVGKLFDVVDVVNDQALLMVNNRR